MAAIIITRTELERAGDPSIFLNIIETEFTPVPLKE